MPSCARQSNNQTQCNAKHKRARSIRSTRHAVCAHIIDYVISDTYVANSLAVYAVVGAARVALLAVYTQV
jgi:hypothetical protein